MEQSAETMESSVQPEISCAQGPTNRIITVESVKGPGLSQSLPSACLRGVLPRRRPRLASHQARSRSMADLKDNVRKGSAGYPSWRDETRVLPSCQHNARRVSVGGNKNYTSSPEVAGESFDLAVNRHPLDRPHSASSDGSASTELCSRSKGDSGIVPDDVCSLSMDSARTWHSESMVSSLGDLGDTYFENVRVCNVQSLSEFESVGDKSPDSTVAVDTVVSMSTQDNRRRPFPKNHSESDIRGLCSKTSDSKDSSGPHSEKAKRLPTCRSLNSLNVTDNNHEPPEAKKHIFDLRKESTNSPESVRSQPSASTLEETRHSDNIANPNEGEGGGVKQSWAFSWPQSCQTSEDSSDDVFLPDENSASDVTEERRLCSEDNILGVEFHQRIAPVRCHNSVEWKQRDENLQSSATEMTEHYDPEMLVPPAESDRPGTNDCENSARGGAGTKDSRGGSNNDGKMVDCVTEKSQSTGGTSQPTINPCPSVQYDKYRIPQSSHSLSAYVPTVGPPKVPKIPMPVTLHTRLTSGDCLSENSAHVAQNSLFISVNNVPSEQASMGEQKSCSCGSVRESGVVLQIASHNLQTDSTLQGNAAAARELNERTGISNESGSGVSESRPVDTPVTASGHQNTPNDASIAEEDHHGVCLQKENMSLCSENPRTYSADKVSSSKSESTLEKASHSIEAIDSSKNIHNSSVEDSEDIKKADKTNENVTPASKGKRPSRVESLLNNNLFKKHLAGHIDLVEKNILKVKKLGLKKSFSNLDLSVTDSEKVQAALESSLKVLDSSATDGSEDDNCRMTLKLDDPHLSSLADQQTNDPAVQSTAAHSKLTRRISLACDDPSLQELHDILKDNTQSPSSTPGSKRGRLHIPSFDEFRRQRSKVQKQSSRSLSSSQSQACPESGDDSHDHTVSSLRTLHTITEDETGDADRSPVSSSNETERGGKETESRVDNFKKSHSMPEFSDITLPDTNKGDTRAVSVKEEANLTCPHEGEAEMNSSQLNTEINNHEFSNVSNDPAQDIQYTEQGDSKIKQIDKNSTEEEAIQTIAAQSNATQSDPLNVTASTFQQRSPTNSCSDNEPVPEITPSITTAGNLSGHVEEKGDDPKRPDLADDSANSLKATVTPRAGQEVVVCDSEDQSPVQTHHSDFPFQLFEDAAVCLDTGSWARLFTQIHKPRRRLRSPETATKRQTLQCETEKPLTGPVFRSSSDVTGQWTGGRREGQRTRWRRKERPYKSDPLADGMAPFPCHMTRGSWEDCGEEPGSPMPSLEAVAEAAGVTRQDSQSSGFPSLEELTEESSAEYTEEEDETDEESRRHRQGCQKRLSNISSTSSDSGLPGFPDFQAAPEPFQPTPGTLLDLASTVLPSPCPMFPCSQCRPSEEGDNSGGVTREERLTLCGHCLQRQQERKETIYEIIETEINYGRDLRILKEEFFAPMQTTGLLTGEQLDSVFLNLEELLVVNEQLTERLRSALHHAAQTADHELRQVHVGSLFIQSSSLFLAFENYCLHQAQASACLEQLERERELLKIFLQVSQAENGLLRRMHLKSFLMAPVQRIMKYPLLLNRVYKATPDGHSDKEATRQAREKIEDILGHINARANESGSGRAKKKQSATNRRYSLTEKIEVHKVALELLGWCQTEVKDLVTSRLWHALPSDHSWASKRGRNLKFALVHAVLFNHGSQQQQQQLQQQRENTDDNSNSSNNNNNSSNNKYSSSSSSLNNNTSSNSNNDLALEPQAAVVLVREKHGKYHAVRDPFLLDKCVVTVDPDCDHLFELQEWGREANVFKAENPKDTRLWVHHLRQQTHNLGQWRRRRNALPNIMLKNV